MINNEINAIKDRICMTIMPKRIYLFGSFAKDTYNEDSDYDFYVVVPDDAGNKIELSQKAYKSLCTSQQKLDTNFKYYLSINLISVQYGASFATFLSG